MLNSFRKYIAANSLIKTGDKVLLAVSGGIDSMVMANLFVQMKVETAIAHCNFSLRGTESDKDEELVASFAKSNNIDFYHIKFETAEYAKKKHLSIQMAARELRYEWFEKIRSENGFASVAVAHNLNDNIETFFINLIRGTGLTGLTGMIPNSKGIIRPMLFATRNEIEKYCNAHEIEYREDRSNSDTKYLRNKIRHQLVPLLKEMNPSVEESINETAHILSEINQIVKDYCDILRKEICSEDMDSVIFDTVRLEPYLHNKTLLFELFKQYGIANVTISDLLNVIKGRSGSRLETGSHRIIKNRKQLLVIPESSEIFQTRVLENIDDLRKLPQFISVRNVTITKRFRIPVSALYGCFDAEKLIFPLILRQWKNGDKFYPLGMNHSRKLSDYFIDRKYSIHAKANALILESDGKVAWIIGERTDNRFRITEKSRRAIIMKLRK